MKIVFRGEVGEYEVTGSTAERYTYLRSDGTRGKALKVNEGITFDIISEVGDGPEDSLDVSVSTDAENTVSDENQELESLMNLENEENKYILSDDVEFSAEYKSEQESE